MFAVCRMLVDAQARHGVEQHPRVVVGRVAEDLRDAPLLDDHAVVHHVHVLRGLPHHAHVVGDEQHGQIEVDRQRGDQGENRLLRGHVERGGRLVGDEYLGSVDDRHGDHHALQLAARQLMRVRRPHAFGVVEPDLAQLFEHLGLALGGAELLLVVFERFRDLYAEREHRIERGGRFLEHRADVFAADALQRRVGGQQIDAAVGGVLAVAARTGVRPVIHKGVVEVRVALHAGHRRIETGQRHRRHRLAGAGFADQSGDAPREQPEADAVGHLPLVEADGQTVHGHDRAWFTHWKLLGCTSVGMRPARAPADHAAGARRMRMPAQFALASETCV